MQNRTCRGQGIRGRPRWGRDNQAVCTLGIHKSVVDLDTDFDHAATAGAIEHDVVQGGRGVHFFLAAPNRRTQQHALFGLEAAL